MLPFSNATLLFYMRYPLPFTCTILYPFTCATLYLFTCYFLPIHMVPFTFTLDPTFILDSYFGPCLIISYPAHLRHILNRHTFPFLNATLLLFVCYIEVIAFTLWYVPHFILPFISYLIMLFCV